MRLVIRFVSLVALVSLATCAHLASAKGVKILDKDAKSVDVESLAKFVCRTQNGNSEQISRVSTLRSLKEYFDQLPEAHSLSECKKRHGDSIRDLFELTTTSNKNVCSDEKVTMIEEFHENYVSTHEKHVRARAASNSREAPQILRLFFMHYAMEVNALCKLHLINNLEWDLKEQFGHIKELQSVGDGQVEDKFGVMFNKALEKFTEMYHVRNFDDVVLFWNLVDGTMASKQQQQQPEEVQVEHDKRTGEEVRLMARVKAVGPMQVIQDNCLNKYKPIYSKLILPIIRLSDLGYSNTGEQFQVELRELRNNPMVKHWYGITQLCEAMIPMKFYEVPEMEPNELVVITKEEAAMLEKEQDGEPSSSSSADSKPIEYEPSTNSFEQVDLIKSVETDEVQEMVANVNTNLLAKNRSMRRAMVHMFHHVKQQFKNKLSNVKVYFSKPKNIEKVDGGSGEAGFEEKEIGKSLSTSLDSVTDEDLNHLEGGSMVRTKTIERKRHRRRKGDVDMIKEMRSAQLSYKRTKTWAEIWDGWMSMVSELAPTRLQMVLFGALVLGLSMILMFSLPIVLAG